MNDSRTNREAELVTKDKTYDLGQGIKVTVARVLAPSQQPSLRMNTDVSALRSPTNSKCSVQVTKPRSSQSPLLKGVRTHAHLSRADSRENIPPNGLAHVQLQRRSPVPQRPAVFDFSRDARPSLLSITPQSQSVRQPSKEQHVVRQHLTSRDASNHNLNMQKHRSERQLSQLALADSMVSDLPDSASRTLQKQGSFVAVNNNATAQFGQMLSGHTAIPQDKPTQGKATLEELTLHWQDLVARSETLEFNLHLLERSRAERRHALDKKREEIENTLAKLRDRYLFLLHRFYSAEDDEEVKVRVASLLEHFEPIIKGKKEEQGRRAVCPDSPGGFNKMFSEIEGVFVTSEDLLRSLEILTDRKKAVLSIVRSGNSWFDEFSIAAETASEVAERDETLRTEMLSRAEELEAIGNTYERSPKKSEMLLPGLTLDSVTDASKWVYENQINRLRVEGTEKLSAYIKKLTNEIERLPSSLCSLLQKFKPINEEHVRGELEAMDAESNEPLVSFLHTLGNLDRAIRLSKAPHNFGIDYIKLICEKFEVHLPSAVDSLHSIIELEFDGRTFGRMKTLLPIINCVESYLIMLFKRRSAEKVHCLLHEALVKSPLNNVLKTPQTATYPSLLRSLENLCEMHLVNPSSPGHLTESDLSAEPLTSSQTLQLCHLCSIQLQYKKKHYSQPLLDTAKQIASILDIFDKSIWVDSKSETLSCSSLLTEVSKLQQKVKEIRQTESEALLANGNKAEQDDKRIEEQKAELSKVNEEIRSVRKAMNGSSARSQNTSKDGFHSSALDRSLDKQPMKVLSVNQKTADRSNSKKSGLALSRAASRIAERGSNSKSGKDSSVPKSTAGSKTQISVHSEVEVSSDDDPMSALESFERDMVMEYCGRLAHCNTKNAFLKKLLRLLEGEFNLDQHCIDWVARGVAGIKVRKGPKIPFGYSGPKKLDALETWSQILDGRNVDLDKMGFGQRVLRFSPSLETFELLRPVKKLGLTSEGGQTYCWDTATAESLSNYNITIEEVHFG
jgi:molecular chaperone GrpE (heat shock protein)